MNPPRKSRSAGAEREPKYPYTRARRDGWQAVVTVAGRRLYGPERPTRREAHDDAQVMRGSALELGSAERVEYLAALKAFLAFHDRESRPATVRFYRQKLSDFMAHVRPTAPLDAISHHDVLRFLEERRETAERSVPHYRRALSAFWNWCVGESLVDASPMLRLPKSRLKAMTKAKPKRFPWLAESVILEICELVEQSTGLFRETRFAADVVRLLYLSGLRRSEACRLTPAHVDFGRGLVYVDGKRDGDLDQQQLVAITPELEPVLRRLVEHAETRRAQARGFLVFANADSLGTHFWRIREWLKLERQKRKEADEPELLPGVELENFTPHAMRHSLGSNLIRKGVPLADVQMILRHKSPVMTSRYVHANAPDLRKSAARASLTRAPDPAPAGDEPAA